MMTDSRNFPATGFVFLLKRYGLPVIILLLPALMFHFMLPFTDTEISPSRDFSRYYMWQQMENMLSVKFGSFPIYIPSVSGSDFCSLSAGYGQLYLPLPYLASLLPGYWTGYAFDWVLLLNLLTISAAHLALFFFLRRLDLDQFPAMALSTLTVYTPRILVSFGYGAGIAAWTGHLFLCTAIGFYFLKPTRIKGPLLIIAAAYWLINSGHPAEVYFCMLAAWVFAIILPYFVEAILPRDHRSFKEKVHFWLFCGGCCFLAFLLSSAYIMPLYFDVLRNMDYANMSYGQAVTNTDTLAGLIYNFFLPTRSGLFGCFTGTSLYLAVLVIPLAGLFRVSVKRVIWFLLLAIGIIFLYMAGESTPIFSALWQSLPFASNTRNPTRASLMMPILFMLALVWLFKTRATISLAVSKRRNSIPIRSFLSLAGLVLLAVGLTTLALTSPDLSVYARLNALFIPEWVEPLVIVLSVIALSAVVLHGLLPPYQKVAEVILCAAICANLVLLMEYGSTPFSLKKEKDILTLERLAAQKQRTLKVVPDYLFLFEKAAHKAEREQLNNYFIAPQLGRIFRKFLTAENRQDAYRILNQSRRQDEVVLEGYHPDAHQKPAYPDCTGTADQVRLTYSTCNRLVFETESCQPAFFVLSYPNPDDHWRAWVNGRKTDIYPANGILQAVDIPAGTSRIEFRYRSAAAFRGTLLSCLTMAFIGILAGLRLSDKRKGVPVAVTVTCLAAGLFILWYHSLYTGKSFGTDYTWKTPSPKQLSNLAYGKPCMISAHNTTHTAYLTPRRGVDGDRSFLSCMITAYHENPWFEIDLQKVSSVGSVVITTSLQGEEEDKIILYFKENVVATDINGIFVFRKVPILFNRLPLVIAISKDEQNWEFAKVDHIERDVPLTVQFEEPRRIRYIRIIADGTCRLCLNEVEVYPPAENPAVNGPVK